jgi:hypothetical protein
MGSLFCVLQQFIGYVPPFPRGIHNLGVKELDSIPLTHDQKLEIAQSLKASSNHGSTEIEQLIWMKFLLVSMPSWILGRKLDFFRTTTYFIN